MDVVETTSLSNGLDLVVVTALSFVEQEPAPRRGAYEGVPLLVISDQPLAPDLEVEGVCYLGFPFGYEGLTHRHGQTPLELTPEMVEDIHVQGGRY